MLLPGFIGPSYTSLSVNADAQRCLNMYLEVLESGQAKNKFALYGTPGLKKWGTLPVAPVRGLWAGDGRLFAAGGNGPTTTLYEMNSNGQVKSVRGTLDADNGGYLPVRMFANGTVLWVVSGDATYYDMGGLIGGVGPGYLLRPTYSADGSYVTARMGAYVDGYFIAMVPYTNIVRISPPLDNTGSWDVLQSFSKSGAPDGLRAIVADHEELYLFGELTGEVWRNTGNGFNGFAFEKDPGGTMEIGIAAAWSACPIHHGVAWISQDVRGRGVAIFASGYQPSRISTHAVEEVWAQYPTITDAQAYAYSEDGHDFWQITFLSGNATWVWDATASEQCGQPIWHERAYNGSSGRQRQICHAFAFETHLVGDCETGDIWQQDLGTYLDGETPITRIRTCPHLCTENLRTFGHQIEIEMEVGNGSISPTLAWSNDRGHTYGAEHTGRLASASAQFSKRIIVDRVGYWRDRIFRLTITDAQKVALINAYLRSTQGTS